jgi:hypothetical protein
MSYGSLLDVYNRSGSMLPCPPASSVSARTIQRTQSVMGGQSRREILNIRSSLRTVTDTSVGFHPIRTCRQISTKIQSRRESCERTDRRDEDNSHRSLANALNPLIAELNPIRWHFFRSSPYSPR